MKPSQERILAYLILLVVLAANLAGLAPELRNGYADSNDNVSHFPMIEGIVQAVEQGANPLDFWAPECCAGYPELRTYQPLGHWATAAIYFALGKKVGLLTIFVWFRYLLLGLLPLSFFVCARKLHLPPLTAAAAALFSPLLQTLHLFGLEQLSFVWGGFGLFPQLVATHFLLLALGFGMDAVREGRRVVLTGILLGATCLSHLIYGYIGAVSLCLLALLPDASIPRLPRIFRTLAIGFVSMILVAFQILPMLGDHATIGRSRWEPSWKWDSYGAPTVLRWLFNGSLLDADHFPTLSLLALGGAGFLVWQTYRRREITPTHLFVLSGAILWLLLFFGRPFWGNLLILFAIPPDFHLHRLIGAVQLFLVLLAAIGAVELFQEISRRWNFGAAALAFALILNPAIRASVYFLGENSANGKENLAANQEVQKPLDDALNYLRSRGGRVYPGLFSNWGIQFKIGYSLFSGTLSKARIPAIARSYHTMPLIADVIPFFDETRPEHYRLFNVQTLITRPGLAVRSGVLTEASKPLHFGPFRVFPTPGGGYFDLVDVIGYVPTDRSTFFQINERWIASDWLTKRAFLRMDFRGDAPPGLRRITPWDALPRAEEAPFAGDVRSDSRSAGEVYEAEIVAARPCYALFKMNWHRNWKAWIDGRPVQTAMLSPGFIGIAVTPGPHHLLLRYVPEWWKAPLALLGILLAALLWDTERRGLLHHLETRLVRAFSPSRS